MHFRHKAALGLALLTLGGMDARPAQAQTATFNFDADAFGTATTFSEISSGDTATFSSPADPGGFAVFPSFFASMTGNVLLDGLLTPTGHIPLDIAFSHPSRSLALNFAQTTAVSGSFVAAFFLDGVPVGSATALGAPVGPNSEGALSFHSDALFNAVRLTSPDTAAFAVDNIRVDVLPAPVPEAPTPVSLGLLLTLGVVVLTRKRKIAPAPQS